MGRGDKRTEKGKRARGSFGKSRNRNGLKARAIAAKASPKKQEVAANATENNSVSA